MPTHKKTLEEILSVIIYYQSFTKTWPDNLLTPINWCLDIFKATYLKDRDVYRVRKMYTQLIIQILRNNPNSLIIDIVNLLRLLDFKPSLQDLEDNVEFLESNFQVALKIYENIPSDIFKGWRDQTKRIMTIQIFGCRYSTACVLALHAWRKSPRYTFFNAMLLFKNLPEFKKPYVIVATMIFLGVRFDKEGGTQFLSDHENDYNILLYANQIIDIFEKDVESVAMVNDEFQRISAFT